jgi:hypothetical protein
MIELNGYAWIFSMSTMKWMMGVQYVVWVLGMDACMGVWLGMLCPALVRVRVGARRATPVCLMRAMSIEKSASLRDSFNIV